MKNEISDQFCPSLPFARLYGLEKTDDGFIVTLKDGGVLCWFLLLVGSNVAWPGIGIGEMKETPWCHPFQDF